MDDIITDFIHETRDSLSDLDNDLLQLEQDPENEELIKKIFRILHTIKGTCGFLGLSRLEKVAHKGEDVLGAYRDKKLIATASSVTLILECFDTIKHIVDKIEATGQEPQGDDSDLINRLEVVYQQAEGGEVIEGSDENEGTQNQIEEAETSVEFLEGAQSQKDEAEENVEFLEGVQEAENKEQPTEATEDEQDAKETLAPQIVQTLRVNVDVLEDLMTMVSELVLTRNQLLQLARQDQESKFVAPLQRLNHVVSDLQEGVMKTRMQPIGNAWAKLPRIVRDVCQELGKKIDLEMHGKDTELDRQILDMIKDPLTHMIRNSADHGVETPDQRLAKGKPEVGRITLNAYHQGGHINIEIADDGKGLSLDKIKAKILQNKLANEEQLENMSSQQIQQFIFHAGFSTAEKVTAVSGRGVGMDVVRSNIEKIGGSIEMVSEENKGTTFTIKIPLTLAIVSALIVSVGDERFAIPQMSISELVMVGKNHDNTIENVGNAKVLRLRGNLLPLVSLSEIMKLDTSSDVETPDPQYVVVAKVGNSMLGLIVDKVSDLEEIVIKPLARNLKNLPIYAGKTILGDGRVIMILDPAGILKTAGMQEAAENAMNAVEEIGSGEEEEHLLLLFKAGNDTLKATPVEMVSRLEEINTDDIEYSNGRPVIQYLGKLMPICNLDTAHNEQQQRPLIILRNEGRNTGLLADKILDIAKFRGSIKDNDHSDIVDSVIIGERAADVINAMKFTQMGVDIKEGGRYPWLIISKTKIRPRS